MGGILEIQNIFEGLEDLLVGFVSIYILKQMALSWILIYNDKNQIMDQIDKLIYIISIIELFLLSFQCFFFDTNLILLSLRCLKVMNQIIIASVLAVIFYDEQRQQQIYGLQRIMIGSLTLFWFFYGLMNVQIVAYNCFELSWRYLAVSSFIISLICVYLCIKSLIVIRNYVSSQNILEQDKIEENLNQIVVDELQNRKVQIQALVISDFVSSFVMLVWEMTNINKASIIQECHNLIYAQNFTSLFFYAIFKLTIYVLPNYAIFYVYFLRNKKYFLKQQDNQQILLNDIQRL